MYTFSQIRDLEIRTLEAIRTGSVFGHLHSLFSAAKQAQIYRHSKAAININLSFTLPTILREDPGHEVIEREYQVGCLAIPSDNRDEISHLSYSVLICQEASPNRRVARKFHFDFEPVSMRNPEEPKPTFHLQLCGKLSEHHRNQGYEEKDIEHLLPSWSQPRVPTQPMSLVLILNWLFIEFGSETPVRDARSDPRWRSLVREAERSILGPYFKACCSFLNSTAQEDQSFFSAHLYEEQS